MSFDNLRAPKDNPTNKTVAECKWKLGLKSVYFGFFSCVRVRLNGDILTMQIIYGKR